MALKEQAQRMDDPQLAARSEPHDLMAYSYQTSDHTSVGLIGFG